MDNQTKERIVEFNKRFGLNTEFITDESVLGYALNNTIYINESIEQDYERTNKHELLHFFEETEEFQRLKQEVLDANRENLEQIRSEYELRYFGLYSEDEINAGVLDNEIVIDLLIDNSVIEYEDGLKIGDEFLGNIEHELEEKRYLNLNLNNNIKNMNLSKWEKIFVANYYDGKERRIPQGKDKQEAIKSDIDASLQELYEMSEEDFKIDPHSPEVIREYESEIKSLKQRGEDTSYLEANKESALKELAEKFSKQLWEEYKHIVDFIKNEDYEPSFKYLMLKETLTKTYKKDFDDGKEKTIIKKRDLHKSVAGHMVLNKTTLDVIYHNLENYDNFANLYFAGLEIFNKTTAEKNEISLEGVETYGKGKWLRFEGKKSNEAEYLKNAEKLASLVKNTPWCTKTLASTQLADGDFFVFVDNEEKPHIAVKTSGNEIDEVRGIKNGNAQELEEDYREVALSFLENNKDIKNGKEWLEKEEWNKRLIEYNKKIDNGELTKEDIPGLIHDLFEITDYRSHGGENSNRTALKKNLEKIKGLLAEYYECDEEEIYTNDIKFSETDYEKCPYKVILGNAIFGQSKVTDLGKLQSIVGNANFGFSQVTDLGNLQIIGGNADFSFTEITDLGSLKSIRGDAVFSCSRIKNLGNLQNIGGTVFFEDSQVTDLGKLERIGRDADFRKTQITDLGNLQSIGGNVFFEDSQVTDLGNLQRIGGSASFRLSQVTDLGKLQSIGGNVVFEDSQVTDLGKLERIGRDADFRKTQITDLGNLQRIGGSAFFRLSHVTDLGKLQSIGGYAEFEVSQVTDLGNLQSIGRGADFEYSKVTDLGNLQRIGEDAFFRHSRVTDLGNLQSIGGNAFFNDSQVTDLGNLQSIGGNADFKNSPITNIGKVNIGGTNNLNDEVKEINEIKKRLMEYNKKIETGNITKEDIPNFISTFFSTNASVFDKDKLCEKLEKIKGLLAEYYGCNEEEICTKSFFGTNYEKCPYKVIFGNAFFSNSQITDLGNLERIGGDANFSNSQVTDFGNLEKIYGEISWGDREDLKQQYEVRQAGRAKREQEELMKIGKRQQQGEFFDFLDKVTDRVNGRENEDIEIKNRGEEVDD